MGAAYSNYMMQPIVYITVSDSRGYWLLCQRASSLLQEIFIFKNSKRDSSWYRDFTIFRSCPYIRR